MPIGLKHRRAASPVFLFLERRLGSLLLERHALYDAFAVKPLKEQQEPSCIGGHATEP
jgi:hypothetical protein